MYSKYYTKSNPGLWVLLTDESEESCWEINCLINHIIQKNFYGKMPDPRLYIHIIGYNGSLKVMASGDLEQLECKPLRTDEVTKKVPDGAGGLVEIKSRMPVWIEPRSGKDKSMLAEAIRGIEIFINEYIKANPKSPAPIVWNIMSDEVEKTDINKIIEEVEKLKQIVSNDGNVLFTCMSGKPDNNIDLFNTINPLFRCCSKIPHSEIFLHRIIYELEFYCTNYKLITCENYMCFYLTKLYKFGGAFMNCGSTDGHGHEELDRHIRSCLLNYE